MKHFAASVIFLLRIAVAAKEADVPYGVGDWSEKLGNHRARLVVSEKSPAVWAHIPWRRRDTSPEKKEIIVVDATTSNRVDSVLRVNINREFGDLLFQPPTAPGEYFVYYLPFKTEGWWAFPTTVYLSPTNRADPVWTSACEPLAKQIAAGNPAGIPAAKVVAIEAINEFNRLDPMEVVASAAELKQLLAAHAAEPYLLFPEDRRYPIRMTDELPLRWIRAGPGTAFKGEACRGEFYAFQIGLFASGQAVEDIAVDFSELRAGGDQRIAATSLRCFNLNGTNWLGESFHKTVSVPKGKVQPLWFGVQVPTNAPVGDYNGALTLRPANAAASKVNLTLTVADKARGDAGDDEIWRHSRLRWLDSTIGLDEDAFPPYSPVAVKGRTATVLGRQVRFDDTGLLDSIQSTFTRSVDAADGPPTELLAAPMRFVVERQPRGSRSEQVHSSNADGGSKGRVTSAAAREEVVWKSRRAKLTSQKPGAVTWESTGKAADLELVCHAKLECDGYLNFKLTLRARRAADFNDIRLEIPLRRELATYMMGLGRKGGYRPAEWRWKWDVNRANNQLWIGDVNAGLSLKLKHVEDRWDLYNLQQPGLYRDWSNDGRGGCDVMEEAGAVVIRAYTGPRNVTAGQEFHFNFGLLITPVKPLDQNHWRWRYFQQEKAKPVGEIAGTGPTLINLHQGDALNPNINYPFLTADRLSDYTSQAHARGLKVKLYYTVRELSDYTTEFWALRSLGSEVFLDGPGFKLADHFLDKKPGGDPPKTGSAWLCEHAISGYVPAWHQPLGNGHCDAAVATTGLSRWHNYYLEGLGWLIRNVGIDGLYLDGVGYDREIMKRVRKVMQRARPGCLIDFHSGNNFHPEYGLNNCANQYLELFPCLDSLWFGEGFDYNEPPDYWLVEISGIPYGLFGEMLQGGGNPWRGMLYGMTGRLGWGGDPRQLWKLWDEFGIQDARMVGYWDAANPVQTDQTNVLATVYLKNKRALIALASWAKEPAQVRLTIDARKLGFNATNARLVAPAIPGFQDANAFLPGDLIPVAPGRGWLLLVKSADETK